MAGAGFSRLLPEQGHSVKLRSKHTSGFLLEGGTVGLEIHAAQQCRIDECLNAVFDKNHTFMSILHPDLVNPNIF